MLIELLGVIAVMAQSRNNMIAPISVRGLGSVSIGWLAVAAGFLIWLTGRIMISSGAGAKRDDQ
ncbi:MAG: hypothetical protein ACLQIB_33840 [Isosphaeraceae bacterium]